MRFKPVTLLAPLLAGLLAACGGGDPLPDTDAADAVPDQTATAVRPGQAASTADLVLQLRRDASIGPVAARHGLRVLGQFGQRPIYRVRVAAGLSADTVLAALQQDSDVRFAERNLASQTPEGQRNSVWLIGGDARAYATQWVPQSLNLPAAHGLSTGRGVRVAVLDTGIDLQHPALASRLARRTGGSLLGYDFVDGDATPAEAGSRADAGFGHGTHVAGLVALAAPGARLMPVRVLDAQGRGNVWVLAEALAWAVDPDGRPGTDDGAHVINLSLGTTAPTQLLTLAVNLATCEFDDDDDDFQHPGFDADRQRCANRFGAVVASAAGNSGSDVEKQYPAAEDVKGTLSVAASNAAHRIAGFSNWGSWVRIAAPGEAVVSTVPGGGWGTWSGTSMAAPLVAGSAALLLATVPKDGAAGQPTPRQWTGEDVMKRLTDRSAGLCATSLRQIDAWAAVADQQAADKPCR